MKDDSLQKLRSEGAGPRLRRDGPLFSIEAGAELPALCVRCGRQTGEKIERTFYWHPAALYVLMPLGLLPYALVVAVVRKKRRIGVPLCKADQRVREQRIGIGALVGFAALPIAYGIAQLPGNAIWVATVVGLVIVGIGARLALSALEILAPKHINDRRATFGAACDTFLNHLEGRR